MEPSFQKMPWLRTWWMTHMLFWQLDKDKWAVAEILYVMITPDMCWLVHYNCLLDCSIENKYAPRVSLLHFCITTVFPKKTPHAKFLLTFTGEQLKASCLVTSQIGIGWIQPRSPAPLHLHWCRQRCESFFCKINSFLVLLSMSSRLLLVHHSARLLIFYG